MASKYSFQLMGVLFCSFLFLSIHADEDSHTVLSFDKKFEIYNVQGGPGLAVLVVKDTKTIFSKGYGYTALDSKKQKITDETNFNLASNSKQFTAMAILLLEQEGKISVEDLISKYIPKLPSYMKDIKIKHLIYHISGLPDYMEVCEKKERVLNDDVISFLSRKDKLAFTPGSMYEYSNSGYVLLSEVIQRVAGTPFPEFIKNKIFSKIGMSKSIIFSDRTENEIENRAWGVGEWPFFESHDAHPGNYVFGDGGIYTSLKDYKRWIIALENGELLQPEFQSRIFKSGTLNNGESIHYGYGWMISDFKGYPLIAHSGAWVGFRSAVAYIPDQKLWVVIFSNYRGIAIWDFVKTVLDEYINKKP